MPERSWLAKVTSIYDLGIWNSCRRDWGRDIGDREAEKDAKLRAHQAQGIPVDPPHAAYFHAALHDGYIVGHLRDGDREYRLQVLCRAAENFHRQMVYITGNEPLEQTYAVEFIAHQPYYVRWAASDNNGHLTFWQPTWDRTGFVGPEGVELLNDWFYREQGRVQWVVRATEIKHQNMVFGMIDAASFSVADHRERLLVEMWGENVRPAWQEIAALPGRQQYEKLWALTAEDVGLG